MNSRKTTLSKIADHLSIYDYDQDLKHKPSSDRENPSLIQTNFFLR